MNPIDSRFWIGGLALALATGVGLGLLWFNPGQWSPFVAASQALSPSLMAPGQSTESARAAYQAAMATAANGSPEDAYDAWVNLETVYPGLLETLRLRQAEALARLPDEARVQAVLKKTLAARPDSPLASELQYQLAQSQCRARQFEDAQATLKTLREQHPNSVEAIGALYFLGLAAKQSTPVDPSWRTHWFAYLKASPDGRFSETILPALEPAASPAEHEVMGRAYWALAQAHGAGSPGWPRAMAHLKQAPAETAWLPLGQAMARLPGSRPEARALLMAHLSQLKHRDDAQAALDALLLATPADQQTPMLRSLALPVGDDYRLWLRAQREPAQALSLYQSLASRHPDSPYAAESLWSLIWDAVRRQDSPKALALAQQHARRYPRVRSAPKVRFWQGRLLEAMQSPQAATQAYQWVIAQTPWDYYAERSRVHLARLTAGRADPGWSLQPGGAAPSGSDGLPWPSSVTSDAPAPVQEALAELAAIGAASDVARLAEAVHLDASPWVSGWLALQRGNRYGGLKQLREAAEADWKAGRPLPTEAPRLLYPVLYGDPIARWAGEQGVDPALVLALTREESHFNPQAISGSNARGLMQLLPSTAREVAGDPSLSAEALADPDLNVRLGTAYLARLLQRFEGQGRLGPMLAVGGYNAGPNAMARWVAAYGPLSDPDRFVESIPVEQTRTYIKKVFSSYWAYQRLRS